MPAVIEDTYTQTTSTEVMLPSELPPHPHRWAVVLGGVPTTEKKKKMFLQVLPCVAGVWMGAEGIEGWFSSFRVPSRPLDPSSETYTYGTDPCPSLVIKQRMLKNQPLW